MNPCVKTEGKCNEQGRRHLGGGAGGPCTPPPPHFLRSKKKKGNKGKQERFSKQKPLKGCH